MKMSTIAVSVVLFLGATAASAQPQPDRFLNVVDGETVVLMNLGQQRLWGINTPNEKTAGDKSGVEAAREALRSMLARTTLTVEKRDYGVILYGANGVSINVQMIESGWARNGLSTRDNEYQAFESAQQIAIRKSIGLWGPRRESSPTQVASSSSSFSGNGTSLPDASYGSADGKFVAVVQAKITESNSTWSRFSWRVTLKNSGAAPKTVLALVEFQDKDGFPVERSSQQRSTIQPGSEEVLTGYELIPANVAGSVAKIVGTIGEPR